MKQSFKINYTNFQQQNIINVPFTDVGLLHLLNLVNMHIETTVEIKKEAAQKKDMEFVEELQSDLEMSQNLMGKLVAIAEQRNLIENE